MSRPNRGTRLTDKPNDRGQYEIVWSVPATKPGGKGRTVRRATGTGVRSEAEQYFARWLLERDQEVDAREHAAVPQIPTLAQVMRAYREGHIADNELDKGTIRAATYMVEHSSLGKLLVTELTPVAVKAYVKARSAGLVGYELDGRKRGFRKGGAASCRNDILYANAALRWAVENLIFPAFTLRELKPMKAPEPPEPRKYWLTVQQADALLAEAAKANRPGYYDPLYLFILIDLDTASRANAVEELTWDRLTLVRGQDGMWQGKADFRVPGRRKTKKRRGENDLTPETAAILALARQCSNHDRVLGLEGPIMFRFRRLTKAVLGTEYGPHILRHSWATWAISGGVLPASVADVLHDTVATVLRVYRHAIPAQTVKAVNFVAGLRAAANDPGTAAVDRENETPTRGVMRGVTPMSDAV